MGKCFGLCSSHPSFSHSFFPVLITLFPFIQLPSSTVFFLKCVKQTSRRSQIIHPYCRLSRKCWRMPRVTKGVKSQRRVVRSRSPSPSLLRFDDGFVASSAFEKKFAFSLFFCWWVVGWTSLLVIIDLILTRVALLNALLFQIYWFQCYSWNLQTRRRSNAARSVEGSAWWQWASLRGSSVSGKKSKWSQQVFF